MEKSYISKFLNEQKNKPLFLIATDNNSFYIYNIANVLVDNDMLIVITKKPYTTYSFPLHNASPHINIAKKYRALWSVHSFNKYSLLNVKEINSNKLE